jgi:PhnB protein
MKPLTPYLSFSGNCREAMNFYKEIFGGNLELMIWGDAPPDACGGEKAKEAMRDKIMHGCLTNGSFNLMAADIPQGEPKMGDSVQLTINCESVEEIDGLFKTLSAGGKTMVPLDNTFWGARFGVLTDKFGFHWMLNCPLEEKK